MASNTLFYRIADDVFKKYPGYIRGVVMCENVKNGPSPDELILMLRNAEAALRKSVNPNSITEHPQIFAWREAYRLFGAKPSEFRSSIEAMARRVLRDNELPTINALVDIGNLISLEHLVPVGGHALDHVTNDLELKPAIGDENFVAFGSNELEHPEPGEIIFTEGKTVLTRRWTWRQANHTLTIPETTAIEFNVDGLAPVSKEKVEQICQEVSVLVKRFCGGENRYELLSITNSQIRLSL